MLALAYLLVWSIEEHRRASELLNKPPARHAIFLIDEIEAHLHPRWQRIIISALVEATSQYMSQSMLVNSIQYIITTHSPLICSSLENTFKDDKDAWFDINLDNGKAIIKKEIFEKMGSVSNWLTSKAFDLKTEFPLEKEKLFYEIRDFVSREDATIEEARKLEDRMEGTLPGIDLLWILWRKFLRSKEWQL